jgi:hypothetical protein
MSVLAIFIYCAILLAGFVYVLCDTPATALGPRAVDDATAMIAVPPELTTDATIGYR